MLVTQFLGALNDNVFKISISYYAIALVARDPGGGNSSDYLALASALFILPFLLFSSYAGQLADRFPKRSVLIVTKSFEIVAVGTGMIAFWMDDIDLMLVTLFLMATHSTFFSPAKYGSLPELLPDRDLSRGNALIEMTTFLAIILGTVAAGFLFKATAGDLKMIGVVMLGIAVLGTLASFGIGRTPRPHKAKPFTWNPFSDVTLGIRQLRADRRLWLTVLGISWFFFLGAWLQLVTLQFARELMGLSEDDASLLQAAIAIGIGLGSLAAGRLSGHKVELGLVPIGSVGLGVSALLLATAASSFLWAATCLALLGFFGGMFVVPLNALLQQKAESASRGRLIAANNVLNTVGILGASGAIWLLGSVLHLRPDVVVLIAGLATFGATAYMLLLLPDFLIRFSLWLLTHTVYRIRIVGPENVPLAGPALLVCNHLSFVDGLLVGSCVQRFVRFMVYAPFFKVPALGWLFRKMHCIPTGGGREAVAAILKARAELQAGHVVCIFAEGAISRTGNLLPFKRGFEKIVQGLDVPIIPVHLDQVWGSIFSFKNGKFFWKWPRRFFYPVTVTFGEKLPAQVRAWDVRGRLLEMGGEAFRHRRTNDDIVPVRFLKTAKRVWFRFAMADSLGRELNFGAALVAALMLGRWFRRERAGEKMVGVLLPASVAAALVNMGLMLAGKTPVNLNFSIGVEAMAAAIRQCEISTVVTAKPFLAKAKIAEMPGSLFIEDVLPTFGGLERALTYLSALLLPTRWLIALAAPKDRHFDDLCTVMFSSGSTGEPKGVMLSHHNIVSNLEAIAQILWVQRDDRIMGVLPFFHSFGFTGTLCLPLTCGIGAVYHANPLDAKTIGGLIRKYQTTILISTPTFCQAYYRACAAEDLKSLRHVVVGAERLRPEFAAQFKEKFGLDIMEGYGSTEMGPVVSVNVPNVLEGPDRQTGHKPGTVGHPVPGVAAKIVDAETGAELKEGQEGLLLLKGPGRMVGYLANPQKTEEVLRDGWYVTGDIAVLDEDGFIRITDRLSRFSKIGGEMVPHLKVEEAMLRIPGVSAACVTAIPDPQKGEKVVAFFVADESMAPELVWKALGETDLPKIWIPKTADLHRIEALPLLGTGKTDLKQLKQMALSFAA